MDAICVTFGGGAVDGIWNIVLGQESGVDRMVEQSEWDTSAARSVFAGLEPHVDEVPSSRRNLMPPKAVFATMPIVLVGSLTAMTLVGAPAEMANAKPLKPRSSAAELGKTIRDAMASANTAIRTTASSSLGRGVGIGKAGTPLVPSTYRVEAGDTVGDIAGRYGLATASVLALNGLSWSSQVFAGQELKLSNQPGLVPVATKPLAPKTGRYTIVAGDSISGIATRFSISSLSLLSANGLGWSSIIYPGQTLAIPGLIGPGSESVVATSTLRNGNGFLRLTNTAADDARALAAARAKVAAAAAAAAAAQAQAAAVAAAAPAPTPSGITYTVRSGDTISSIAARFGVSTDDILHANGLDRSSIIYVGDKLLVPGARTASIGGDVTLMNDEMRSNAAIIVHAGRDIGVPDYGIVIALAAAMQESRLRNLSWGDLDSVGLFQQRPSAGWGSVDQLTDPYYAAQLFYGGPSNPNRGNTRGLLDISGWQSMTLTRAAQAVQVSAYPNAYAKWESSAWEWLSELG